MPYCKGCHPVTLAALPCWLTDVAMSHMPHIHCPKLLPGLRRLAGPVLAKQTSPAHSGSNATCSSSSRRRCRPCGATMARRSYDLRSPSARSILLPVPPTKSRTIPMCCSNSETPSRTKPAVTTDRRSPVHAPPVTWLNFGDRPNFLDLKSAA